jgi:glycine/D-amino acid oxidase-like deaminating enzyme
MPAHTFEPADVAIIGGGIVGLATALNLATRGLKVAVFERGRVASEQSSRAWGFIRQQGRHEAEIPLAAEANRLWIELTERFGFEATCFTPAGILVPAETDADEERVISGHDVASKFQLSTKILSRTQIRELIPQLAGDWRSGLYTAGDAHAEPGASTFTVARAAKVAGARIYENEPVVELDCEAGRIAGVVTLSGYCKAPLVVLASGIGAASLARRVGINLPVQVIQSSVGQTVAAQPFTKVAMWAPKVAYRPRADGSLIIGNGYRGVGADYEVTLNSFRNLRHFLPAYRRNWRLLRLRLGADFLNQLRASLDKRAGALPLPEPQPNLKKVRRNLEVIRSMFPHLGRIELERSWAGRIDLTPDVIPIIDRPEPALSVFVAAGFSGHGFALAPSIGRQLAEWIMDGRPSIGLNAFRLSRFAESAAETAKQAL